MDYSLNDDMFDKIVYQIKLLFVPFEANKYSPKFLQSKILFYFVILVLVLRIFSVAISLNFPKYTFFADISETDLVKMVNTERTVLGLKPLAENVKLDQAAMLKAKDMIANGYFAHQSPSGTTPWYWFKQTNYNYKYAGENLAIGFTESIDVYNAWFDSNSHRENFLNPNYNEIGTAVLTGNFDGNNATVVVQLFGKQKTPITPAVIKTTPTVTNAAKPPIVTVKKTEPIEVLNAGANMAINTEKGKNLEIPVKKEVLSAEDSAPAIKENSENTERNLYSQILNIIFYSYDEVLQKIIFALFIFVSIISIVNIVVNYNIQNRQLVLKSFAMVLLLCVGTFLNKDVLVQILSQQIL